jgi:hydrogenase maturation protein HypF
VVHGDGAPVLATGGELKNTLCLLKDRFAFMSQHIGDLENLEAYDFFNLTHTHLRRILETEPELVVHDLHPGYLSTKWAIEQKLAPALAVQHHHAHLAAVMAEHGLDEPVLGIILDGTGYGSDGTIWGGEFLLGDYAGYERVGHLEPMLLPGGDSAIKAPWRIAYAYLLQALEDLTTTDFDFLQDRDVSVIETMIANNFQTVKTSSMGRLFDAVAALSGGLAEIRYEAQAAIEFMQAAEGRLSDRGYELSFTELDHRLIWELKPLIRAIAEDVRGGVGTGLISQRFHASLVQGLVEVGQRLSQQHGVRKIALSGGVFQNQLLFENIVPALTSVGLEVFTHEQVPTNDGGIALGQAMIGRYHLHKSTKQEND